MFRTLGLGKRDRATWALDLLGLLSQGTLVPLIQTWVLAKLLGWAMPSLQGTWSLSGFWSFCLSFILVDYLYYWNHRMLHSELLWPLHQVHHSIRKLDILATSRNSAWTVFFIVYLWIQPVFVFLLKDPTWFMIGLFTGYTLDIWRHSGWTWNRKNRVVKMLSAILIDPQDHEWHHSEDKFKVNFGANLNLWDRLHGTFHRSSERPKQVGVEISDSFSKQFLVPWRIK